MSQIETLGLLDQIQSLVSDELQVVSYKWLSRNFLLSSNAAKRLLQQFVDKHGSDLDIVYSLSGWLKDASSYHILLVSGPLFAEAKEKFDGNCSVRVYSIQASIPKDTAALWNTEFLQAEELFKQPSTVDNCLRDNRFCGVSNSSVKRNVAGASVGIAAPQPKGASTPGSSKNNFTVPTLQQKKIHQSSGTVGQMSNSVVIDVKSENNSTEISGRTTKPQAEKKEAICPLPANGKKNKNDKNSGGGGSLANMWGRASVKSKPSSAPAENNKSISAEAQIRALEELDVANSDDDGQNVSFKRASNGEGGRKRKVVLDYSDEEEDYNDAVNLASPDPPKEKSLSDSKQSMETLAKKGNYLNFVDQKENDPVVKEEKATIIESNQPPKENQSVSKDTKAQVKAEKIQRPAAKENDAKQNATTHAAPSSPKRKKVMKTRIDERGREVTEVVWEGEETDAKKDECNSTKKTDNNAAANTVNRPPPVAKKSPAIRNTTPSNATGKVGNKKGATKDPKQGNIMSFFKKV